MSESMTDAFLSGDTIKVDHVFTFKLERSIRKMGDRMLDLAGNYAESFRYIAIGLSAYLILSGMAHVVCALGTADHESSSSSKSKKKSSKKDKSESSKTEAKSEAKTDSANTERKIDLESPK